MLVFDALVRATEVDTSSHLVGALLGHREECGPKAVRGVRRKRTDGTDGEITLQSLGTGDPLLAAGREAVLPNEVPASSWVDVYLYGIYRRNAISFVLRGECPQIAVR